MEQKYQSEFAWEMVNKLYDRECQYKSQFAAELQSSLVSCESQESSHEKSQESFQENNQESFDDTTEDKKKVFDDSNYSYLEGDYPSEKVTINQLRPRE